MTAFTLLWDVADCQTRLIQEFSSTLDLLVRKCGETLGRHGRVASAAASAIRAVVDHVTDLVAHRSVAGVPRVA
jgi:hypothetical protein